MFCIKQYWTLEIEKKIKLYSYYCSASILNKHAISRAYRKSTYNNIDSCIVLIRFYMLERYKLQIVEDVLEENQSHDLYINIQKYNEWVSFAEKQVLRSSGFEESTYG